MRSEPQSYWSATLYYYGLAFIILMSDCNTRERIQDLSDKVEQICSCEEQP